MTREEMCLALKARALELGWSEAVVEDDGANITVLVSAPGAAEQITDPAPLSRARKELSDLGGPEDYPATEEYDLPPEGIDAEDELPEPRELAGVEEPATPAKEEEMSVVDLLLGLVGWNPPPEAPPVKATAPKGEFSYNTPCFTQAGEGGEEIKPHTWEPVSGGPLGPKEIWQGRQIIDQDRGGIPDPGNYQEVTEQAVVVLTVGQTFKAPEGYVIKEYRPGRPTPIFYGSIARGRKARYQGLGSKFVLVEKAQAFPA